MGRFDTQTQIYYGSGTGGHCGICNVANRHCRRCGWLRWKQI